MYEFLDYQVQDVMSRPVCIRGETTLAEAEALLEKHGWNGVPVVDAAERPVGFFTSLDLLKAFAFSEDMILPSVRAHPRATRVGGDVARRADRLPAHAAHARAPEAGRYAHQEPARRRRTTASWASSRART